MPLVKINLRKGRSTEEKDAIAAADDAFTRHTIQRRTRHWPRGAHHDYQAHQLRGPGC